MNLSYPVDFHSTLTYQNANFTFPHDTGLSMSYNLLKDWFFHEKYIVPSYIKYGNPKAVNVQEIIDILKNDKHVAILGTSFMRLKSLEEQLDTIYDKLIEWKGKQIKPHSKFQQEIDKYINLTTYNQLLPKINIVINYVQIIIINVINYVGIHGKIPTYLHNNKTITLINLLNDFVNITTINIIAGNVIYLIRTIPILNKIYDYLIKHYKLH